MVIFVSVQVYAQQSVKGRVIDGKSREPLAFVNIIFNNDQHAGVTTDIDGRFYYQHSEEIKLISCSYLGYKKLVVNVDTAHFDQEGLLIELQALPLLLEEVQVRAGENPAHRIIRNVISNKNDNNPEKMRSFRYTSYNKTIYDLVPNDSTGTDILQQKIDKLLKGGHLLMMESVTERKFLAPDLSEELITGVKVSGFKRPGFAPLATDLQPFSFYHDVIRIFDVKYLNPISDGSLKRYKFHLADTIYQGKDTVFIISFTPQAGKNFDALSGTLYISSNNYAVQNVIAEPFKKGLIDIRIQQQYVFIDGKQWFPHQLNFELSLSQYPSKTIALKANGRSYIQNIQLLPDLRKKDFAIDAVSMHELATERDSAFWASHRSENINKREAITYNVIDSIAAELKLEKILSFSESLARGRIPIKFMELDLSESFVYNKFEGFRLGLGLHTNEKVSKYFTVGGYYGYGLRDKLHKYGGEFTLFLNRKNEVTLKGQHQYTLFEPGDHELDYYHKGLYNPRNYMSYLMDRVQRNSLSFGFRALRYASVNLGFHHSLVQPLYNYAFNLAGDQVISNYTSGELRINLRYAYGEKLISLANTRLGAGTKYPVLTASYTRGVKDLYNSDFEFNRIEAAVDYSRYRRNLGLTDIRIEAGYVDRALPYGLLFTGEGAFDNEFPVFAKNHFQTLMPYEFLSDRYINLFFSHNFGGLLLKIKDFNPHFILRHNMGFGTLSNPQKHIGMAFKTKEQGFLESGLHLDNLLKINYLNVAYLGIGAGVYCRYGAYSGADIKNNLGIKMSVRYSTR